jgi:hypothetical protein
MAERNAATLARYIVKAGLHTINRRELRRGAGKASLPWARFSDTCHSDAPLGPARIKLAPIRAIFPI